MTFAQFNLNPSILTALTSRGYKAPTPVQTQAIPSILNGNDLIASAQTGTGKTAAFVLPMLHRLSSTKATKHSRALILTPTRELATQITNAIAQYGKHLQLSSATIVGGMPYPQQIRMLARRPDIIIATPGRLLDHLENGKLKLHDIEMLVLDEADRMLDMGFIDEVKIITKATPQTRQTLLFSATVCNRLAELAKNILKNPQQITVNTKKTPPTHIKQKIYLTDNEEHKNKLLKHLLKEEPIYKAIIFSATKHNADKLAKQIRQQGYNISAMHGDLKQSQRNKTLEQLRKGKIQLLVATDVAARGIDVSGITHVINYDLPKFVEDYVHRIGRTGRAGESGIAISFALPSDKRHLQRIEKYTEQKLTHATIEGLEPTKSYQQAPAKKKKRRPTAKKRRTAKPFKAKRKST